MKPWKLNSNACDVLGLGPRTAGQLATVGIRTVAELLSSNPQTVCRRLRSNTISADTLAEWQYEATLLIALPELPADAARMLATVGIGDADKLRDCTPTQLLATLETVRRDRPNSWLAQTALPTIAEVSDWIQIAWPAEIFRAA